MSVNNNFTEATTMQPENPTLSGRYRVIRQLGQGGMGSVYLAEDTKLDNRRVAIKTLPSILIGNKTGGTKKTLEFAVSHQMPHLVIFAEDTAKVIEWLKNVLVRLGGEDLILNVAGPRESKAPGIQSATRQFITKLIEQCKENEKEVHDAAYV